jgi:hypothetical protein
MDWVAIIGGLVIAYLLLQIYRAIQEARAPPPKPAKWMVGDITQHTLQFHNGMDYSKPTLIAVQGILYDVTDSNDVYGPSKCMHCAAGMAVSGLCYHQHKSFFLNEAALSASQAHACTIASSNSSVCAWQFRQPP